MKRAARLLALAALSASTRAQAGVQPRYGGELRVALPAAPAEIDPARAASPAELAAVEALHATLVEIDPTGALRPGLLAILPEAEPGNRAFRMHLRPGLKFHDGTSITAADVAASLSRLLAPDVRSPHGWVSLAIEGAEAVRQGTATALSGVQALSETELRVALDVPFPEFPGALAVLPAAIVPRGAPAGVGAGPFRLADRSSGPARLVAFDGHHRGRPYLDAVSLVAMDGRRTARAFSQGDLGLALRPEAPAGGDTIELPALTTSYALVNAGRLGAQAGPIRRVLGAVDRTELVRLYVRGPAAPLSVLLPPALSAGGKPPPRESGVEPPAAGQAPASLAPARLVLLIPTGVEPLRPVADRIQVKLFDRGLRVSVEPLAPEALAARLAARDFDLALTSVTLVSARPSLAMLQLAWALGGPRAARSVLARLTTLDPLPLPSAVEEELGAVPLFARGLRATARPELQGFAVAPDGGIDLGDVWLLSPRRAR